MKQFEVASISNDPTVRYVLNFNRAASWGAGHGHISRIVGYLEAEDLVFVGDVNERYRPFLAHRDPREAVNTRGASTGRSRGLLRVGASADQPAEPQ